VWIAGGHCRCRRSCSRGSCWAPCGGPRCCRLTVVAQPRSAFSRKGCASEYLGRQTDRSFVDVEVRRVMGAAAWPASADCDECCGNAFGDVREVVADREDARIDRVDLGGRRSSGQPCDRGGGALQCRYGGCHVKFVRDAQGRTNSVGDLVDASERALPQCGVQPTQRAAKRDSGG